MARRFHKYFWASNLVTLALCAFFAARAAGDYLASSAVPAIPRLSERQPPERQPPATAAPVGGSDQLDVPTTSSPHEIQGLVQRNVFCSSCAPHLVAAPVDEADAPASRDPVRTSLALKLIATLVSEEDSAWSFAAVLDGDTGRTRLVPVGGRLAAGAHVTAIADRRIELESGGRAEFLDMSEGAGPGPGGEGGPPPRVTPPGGDLAAGIRALGAGRYEIDRAVLNKVLGNTALLATSARIIPAVRDGQPAGFTLDQIRAGSVYALLGMQNRDVVHAVNGHGIKTPDDALLIYTRLRNASHVTLSFTRQSQTKTHDYTIR